MYVQELEGGDRLVAAPRSVRPALDSATDRCRYHAEMQSDGYE